jgi:hypothetical protein
MTTKEENILKGIIENNMKDEEYQKKQKGKRNTIKPFEIGK